MNTFERIDTVPGRIVAGMGTEREWAGEQITEPGVYRGVPIDVYHQRTDLFDGFSISSSGLKRVVHRPSEYWAFSPFNPDREPEERSAALNFGAAAHCLLLGDEDFAARYAIRPEELDGKPWQGNRTACKEWLEAMASLGKIVVTPTDIATIERISEALRRHPLVADGLLSGRAERTMCVRSGSIWIKSRPDIVPTGGIFADLKTAADVSDDGIMRAIAASGLHIQAGLMRKIARELGMPFDDFALVFVEKAPPFDVRVKVLKPETLDIGERQVNVAIKTVERCLREGRWPGFDGFGNAEGYTELPSWAATRIKTNLEVDERELA